MTCLVLPATVWKGDARGHNTSKETFEKVISFLEVREDGIAVSR